MFFIWLVLLLGIIILSMLIWIIIPRVRERNRYVSVGKEWLSLLKQHPNFSAKETGYQLDVKFLYAEPRDENLQKLRETFSLGVIAGQGSEIEKIINLMTWVYQLTAHANEPEIPEERDAFTLIHKAQVENKQINCYMKTIILNEVYVAMGFHSRHTHLLPHSNEKQHSHFVTSVYSHTLEKWILMDPDFGAYVTDGKGNILGVSEIRQHLISEKALKTIHPDRNRFRMFWLNLNNFINGADYLWFLSIFVFKIRSPRLSAFAQDTQPAREYFELIPDGYNKHLLQEPLVTPEGNKIFYMNDEHQFWHNPL